MNLADILTAHAAARPDHPAIIGGSFTLSYGELDALVGGAAALLQGEGVGPRDLVGVLLRDQAAYLVIAFALARLGAILQPIETHHLPAEQERAVRAMRTKFVVAGDDAAPPPGPRAIRIDRGWWRAAANTAPAGAHPDDPELPFQLSTSSGTTATPKPFLITHAQQYERLRAYGNFGLDPGHRYFSFISPQSNMGLRGSMAALHFGGAVIVNQPVDTVGNFLAAAKRQNATWTYLMPTYLRSFLGYGRGQAPLLPGMRMLMVAGSKLWRQERDLAREKLTPNLYEVYGANEVGIVAAAAPSDQTARPDAVGRAIPGFAIEIVDDAGGPVAAGGVGEVRFRGPGMTAGYLNNPEATARNFRQGWFHPGDLAAQDAAGYLFLKGRTDDVINRGGVKIYPADIETVLLGHPAVADVAVVGFEAPGCEEVPVAFIVRRAEASEPDLAAFCRERLPAYRLPNRFHFVAEMPRNEAGKIAKRRLLDLLEAETGPLGAAETGSRTRA